MLSIKERNEKRELRKKVKNVAQSILNALSNGATSVEFGSVALVHDGNFEHLIKIDFTKVGEETSFPYSVEGVIEALQLVVV